jgi:hypothetical protein
MKRFIAQLRWVVMLAFALCSIGAESSSSSSGCKPSGAQSSQGTQSNQGSTKPWCYMDPPVNCVAFCVAVNKIAFTPMCGNIEAGELTDLFMEEVINDAEDLEAQSIQVCPGPDSKHWVTPCGVGINPVEHPNQDHEVCQPVPPGCVY